MVFWKKRTDGVRGPIRAFNTSDLKVEISGRSTN
jgi:hypothetical protein